MTFIFTPFQHGDKFEAVITVTGPGLTGNWWLTFQLPGTRIGDVVGVAWHASSSQDGGTATPLPSDGRRDHRDATQVNFMVIGHGQALTPSGCVFDGISCTFSQTYHHPEGRQGQQ
jgi:hypothetical protein